MADTDKTLELGLALIRSDLDKITAAVRDDKRVMEMGESIAVVRYVGVLVDVQRAELAAERAAEKEAASLTSAELLQRLSELPGVRDALDHGRAAELPAVGKRRRGDSNGVSEGKSGRRGD